ncbi:MAG TPA: hypothetical protein VES20_21995 [Bryobacteraceae bacterium]|nr:hypothetical protein [Bryobacteraceae bacterium]
MVDRLSIAASAFRDTLPTKRGPTRTDLQAGTAANLYSGTIARLFAGPEFRRVIAVTSVNPGEGVTWTATRMASEVERVMGLRAGVISSADLLARFEPRPPGAGITFVPAARATLSQLRSEYDVILVDAGSMSASGSAIGLCRLELVDAVVLVVEAGRTKKHAVRRALQDISAANGKVAGCLLNKRRFVVPAWLEALIG